MVKIVSIPVIFIFMLWWWNTGLNQIKTERPNIVLIVADDLGFSDLGCFGSEISTPNIDELAATGQIFTNFHTAPTCSPTRAMLLSGTDNHMAGLGNMAEYVPETTNQPGQPGYEGHLNDRVVSVAELIRESGYHTYIAGKWHLGLTPQHSPLAHGFERSYTLLNGAANHYQPDPGRRLFWEDTAYTKYPNGQYSTELYTDKLISFLENDRSDGKPFFMFAAYTSPHWPLQAPAEFVEKYRGKYSMGYDSLRFFRFEGLKKRGIIPENLPLPDLPAIKGNLTTISDRPLLPWDSLSDNERKIESRKMELFAAMVDNLDYHVGQLITYLKDIGKFKNTVFIFFSDNGAAPWEANRSPEGVDIYQNMGAPNSFVAYGPQWAHASVTVFRLYKGYTTEGGIRAPLIVKLPGRQDNGQIRTAFTSVMDLAPTFLQLVETTYPDTIDGRKLAEYKGKSLLPYINGEKARAHETNYVMGWELFGRSALRKGSWKIIQIETPLGKGKFELYNLDTDPLETEDLSEEYPEKYKELIDLWKQYRSENNVIIPEWKGEGS
jgi:arylsulfatase